MKISEIFLGETSDHMPVAIKLSEKFQMHEFDCYKELHALTNKTCEKFGVPFIHNHGEFFHFQMLAMTRLDTSLDTLLKLFAPFSKENILIIARDMVRCVVFFDMAVASKFCALKSSFFLTFVHHADQNT